MVEGIVFDELIAFRIRNIKKYTWETLRMKIWDNVSYYIVWTHQRDNEITFVVKRDMKSIMAARKLFKDLELVVDEGIVLVTKLEQPE